MKTSVNKNWKTKKKKRARESRNSKGGWCAGKKKVKDGSRRITRPFSRCCSHRPHAPPGEEKRNPLQQLHWEHPSSPARDQTRVTRVSWNCHSPLSDLDHILAILWIVCPSLSTWKAGKEPKREKEKGDLAWTQKVSQDIHRTLVVDYEAKDTDREVGGGDDDQGIIGVGGYRR